MVGGGRGVRRGGGGGRGGGGRGGGVVGVVKTCWSGRVAGVWERVDRDTLDSTALDWTALDCRTGYMNDVMGYRAT